MASPNLAHKIRLLSYYSMLWVVGFFTAFWFGLGWFFLFHSIRYILLSSPKLYLSTIKIVVGPDFAESERKRLQGKENYWFSSKVSMVLFLINILFTVFVFWKINIPIISIFK
jgi:hypothetical protein